MSALVALFLRRPVFTWVLVLGAVVLGIDALGKMPVERFPNLDFAYVSVTVNAPGMSAEQMESEIAVPIENALGTVSGLDRLDSTSLEGSTLISAQFTLDKNSMEAANEVRDRVSRLADTLPPAARPPQIETFDLNGVPILVLAVRSRGDARTPRELTELAETVIRRDLQSLRGVGEVRLVGGETRALVIDLDPIRLHAADLTAAEVRDALARENLEAPGGSLVEGDTSVGLRLSARAHTAEELADVVVSSRGGVEIRLRDLGTVEDSVLPAETRASISGAPAVLLTVTKQPGANTVAVSDDVRHRIELARERLPDGVEAVVMQDNSEEVRASVEAVVEHLILGAFLAAIVVLVFLRDLRATAIAGLAIPTSILGTFAIANAMGLSLNLLSLLGLTLAVGIVIDDAIVVVENVVRVMRARGIPALEATVEATGEIALAVLATTLSLVAVFLPVAMMEGIVGRYLAPFSLTMAASILISMAVAFSLTPMLASRWLVAAEPGSAEHHDTLIERGYARAVAWLLRHRWVAGLGIVITLVSIVPLGMALPATFVPEEDVGRFAVSLRLPEGASLDHTASTAEEIATWIEELPDVRETIVLTSGNREATVTAVLGRTGIQAARIRQARRIVAQRLAGRDLLTMVAPAGDMEGSGPENAAIQFVIQGNDRALLQATADRLLVDAKRIPGTVDHGLSSSGARAERAIRVDRVEAARLGISHAEIGRALGFVERRGVDLGSVRDPDARDEVTIPVRMRLSSGELTNDELVRALPLRRANAERASIADVARVEPSTGPGVIRRVGRQRQITVFMNTVPGTNDAAVVTKLEAALRRAEPTGRIRAETLGDAKELEKTAAAFFVAIGLSFVFMYLVLAAQFESWLHPVTILASLPLTVPFGLLSLLIFGQSLNLFSGLGFLVLFGVVKKNSILQIDRTLQLRAEGLPRDEAVLRACRERLRPILMTTLAFVAGMIPLVVSSGPGSATNRAIAVGVMGGQSFSLALTLLATPILYTFLDDLASRVSRLVQRGERESQSPSEFRSS